MRTAPPSPPAAASTADFESVGILIAFIGLLVTLVTMTNHAGLGYVFLGVLVFGLGMLLWWDGQQSPGQREAEAQRYQAQVQEYLADLELYKKLWICLDCGKIFIPQEKPSNFSANGVSAPTKVRCLPS